MKTLLTASFFACAVASFAYAPVVRPLPDVTIGDKEDNIGATDNNWFVFTNAFQFDSFVSDADTTVSSLKWSFDELTSTSTTPWFTVNDLGAIHVGDTAIANLDDPTSDTPHSRPDLVGKDLRAASPYASFRDIIMSPGPGTGPFPAKDAATIGAHTTGRQVRFYVSDTNSVVRAKEIFVNIADNGNDKLSGGTPFVLCQKDEFTTANIATSQAAGMVGGKGWFSFGLKTNAQTAYPAGTLIDYNYDSNHTAFRGKVYSSKTANASDYRYRNAGWFCAEWLPFSVAGTDKVVRAKYYVYTEPINTGDFTLATSTEPGFRMRVGQRYAYVQQLEISRPAYNDVEGYSKWADIKASTDWQKPSLYRVDFWPSLVPQAQASTEGFMRGFEAYCVSVQAVPDQGYICLAESQIGVYPKSALTESVVKTYDAANLANFSTTNDVTSIFNYSYANMPAEAPDGFYPAQESNIASELGTWAQDSTGVTISTVNCPSTKIGVVSREFNPDGSATANNATRVRVKEGKQYRISWHMTSTRNTADQAAMCLRARTCKFAYLSRLEFNGPNSAGTENNNIVKQTWPGVGCQNPDKNGTETNGGWYHQMMVTPLNVDIRPDVTGANLAAKMPVFSIEPGSGSASPSLKDLKLGFDAFDSPDATGTYATEAVVVKIDQVVIREADLIGD